MTVTLSTYDAEAELDNSLNKTFERDGYVVIEGALSRERADVLRRALIERSATLSGDGPHTQVVLDSYIAFPDSIDTLANEKGILALKALLGDDFVVLPDSSITVDRWNVLHTDTSSWEMAGMYIHRDPGFRMVTVGLYLQDAEEGAGGLYVVPGSHLRGDPTTTLRRKNSSIWSRAKQKLLGGKSLTQQLEALPENVDGVNIPSKAGDMIVFDMRMLHRSQSPDAAVRPAPSGGRIAFFSRCVRNNPDHIRSYIDYMKQKPDGVFLLDPERRPSEAMRQVEKTYSIQML
jgi:ectoine hydroxylase-related dioxygenase (phytanoyl-CoA dioxygenase family)